MTDLFTTALIGLFTLGGAVAADTAYAATEPQVEAIPSYTVSMTGYNAVSAQTDGDPHTTASGAFANPDVVAARSVDLAANLPYGTVIEIVASSAAASRGCGIHVIDQYLGLRVIADSMHSRKRNQVDVLFNTKPVVRAGGRMVNAAVALGICQGVEIHVVGKIDMKKIPKTQDELRLAVGQLEKAKTGNLVVKVGK